MSNYKDYNYYDGYDDTPFVKPYNGKTTSDYKYTTTLIDKHKDHPATLIKLGGISLAGWAKMDLDMFGGADEKRLVINCSGTTIGAPKASLIKAAPASMADWKLDDYLISFDELALDWEDRKAINLKATFWPALVNRIVTAGYNRVDVCCVGGHGRTGTALCCLLAATPAFVEVKDAYSLIKWLRKKYCKDAVESEIQLRYVKYIWEALRG